MMLPSIMNGRYLMAWCDTVEIKGKKHRQFRMKCFPLNNISYTQNIKTKKVNKVLNQMRRDGWHIIPIKPSVI